MCVYADIADGDGDGTGSQMCRKQFRAGNRFQSFTHDAAGTRTTWPDGYYVQYTYDALNRMDVVLENGSVQLANYDYDTLSRRDFLTLANNATNTVDYVYEADSQLDLLTHRFGAQPTLTLDYGRNHSGQITSLQATDQYYLLGFTNQSSQAYVPNKLNQYDSVNGRDFQYDANGNLTQWYSETAGWSTYTYDTENRLRTAATQGSATATISYDYDPLGRRISKTVNGTTTHYLLDGDEEIAELSASGSILRRYIMGPAIDDRIAWIEGGATSPSGSQRKYYHVNHQSSVLAVTSADGTPVASYTYDAYGRPSNHTEADNHDPDPPHVGTFNASGGQPYRYTGRRYDVETGLYYYRARYYAPELGRFLQTDPIGYEADSNLYTYADSAPVNLTDPTGEAPESVMDARYVYPNLTEEQRDLVSQQHYEIGSNLAKGMLIGADIATTMSGPVGIPVKVGAKAAGRAIIKSYFSRGKRSAGWEAAGRKCEYCGKKTQIDKPYQKDSAEGDHYTPISRGGRTSEDNFISSCRECNGSGQKGNKLVGSEWQPSAPNERVRSKIASGEVTVVRVEGRLDSMRLNRD